MRAALDGPPQTYNEKIRYKMAFDRRPLLTRVADKVAVRQYVAERIGERFLATAYAVADDPNHIDWAALPTEYVAKVNHSSGGMVLVWDGADPTRGLPADPSTVGWDRPQVHPDALDEERLVNLLSYWLAHDFAWFPGKGVIEWAYEDVQRKVLVEEFLRDADGLPPRDLKFTMVGGKVIWIQVDNDRFGHHSKDLMSTDWQRIPVEYNRVPVSAQPPARPRHLETMLDAAESLGAGFDFVRADFYELGDRIVFGEMTNYPACGNGNVSPSEFDELWGSNPDWACPYGPFASGPTSPDG